MRRCSVPLILAVLIFAGLTVDCTAGEVRPFPKFLNSEAVYLLLDLMHMVRDRNPDFADWNERLEDLKRPQRQALLDSLSMSNRRDVEVNTMIDSLLSTEAYQLYYRNFSNIKPDDHRQMLLRLPYGWVDSPAGISQTLYDICLNQDSVAAWIGSFLGRVDRDKVQKMALAWLPDRVYPIQSSYLLMDGNGDAFAAKDQVLFDLYGVILSPRPRATRYVDLADITVDKIESTLAHEFHHVFAGPIYDLATESSDELAILWRQRLIRRMVSEGSAMHCEPPYGVRRATMEDTATVAFWFKQLSQTLKGMEEGEITDEEIRQWYGDSSHDTARKLLRDYLARSLEGEALNREVNLQGAARPTLVYTLGWWMVSQISRQGTDRDAVIDLVQDPYSLFDRYNAIASGAPDSLRAPQ